MSEIQLPDELVELVAERFRAIGDPLRIRILEQLRGGPCTVQEIVTRVGSSQQNISKHLSVLRGLGIVARERDGVYARYSIADESVLRLCDEVCGTLKRQVAELHKLIGEEASA